LLPAVRGLRRLGKPKVEADLLSRIAEGAGISEEETGRVLEVLKVFLGP